MLRFRGLITLIAFAAVTYYTVARGISPQFPTQFSATVEITSHLVDRTREYPPRRREMRVWYDYVAGRAKVAVTEGLLAGKIFLRIYASKKEYMIRGGDYASCRRSYLGEAMPAPQYPGTALFQGTVMVDGFLCEHWLQNDWTSQVHIYIDKTTQAPRRLTEEAVTLGTTAIPLVTYDFLNFKAGPQAQELFNLPQPYESQETCDLHVGGYPYLHLFHHYLIV
ncbi:unnamed protein product [Ascophyllum nodosum]